LVVVRRSGEAVTELLAAVVGAVVGAAIAYFCSVRLMERERRDRQEDDARDLARRQGEMRVALASALEGNVALLRELHDLYGKVNVPPTVDLVVLDATSQAKYGLLDVSVCEAVDVARGKLAAIRRAMDHLAVTYGQAVASSTSRSDASIESRKAMLADITGKHVPAALTSCEAALVALRGHGAKPVQLAKPAKTASAGDVAGEAPE
jgi:hypothetical protein